MNAQPFYHRVDGLLFTARRVVTEEQILKAIRSIPGVEKASVEIEPEGYSEPEAGDPADL